MLAFGEINKISMEILIELGYELAYADTDSVFLKKKLLQKQAVINKL